MPTAPGFPASVAGAAETTEALPVLPAMAEGSPAAYVEEVVRRSGTSFFWGMRRLPLAKRQAMFAIYAFCREVDDIADEPGEITAKRRMLAAWRGEIDALYRGEEVRHAVTRVLADCVTPFDLRRSDFVAIIDGMDMDAADRVRIADMAELSVYCDRVACAVGRLSVRVFGVAQPQGDQLADALGNALQLTNILRDLKEDARRDRLYVPAELLRAYGIGDSPDAEAMLCHPAVPLVCERLAALARQRFDAAAGVVALCDRRAVRPARMMMEAYRRTFQQLVARGWERWAEPVHVSPIEKLWVALRYGLL